MPLSPSAPHADNHANIPPLSFLQAGCPSWRPTNSVKALKAQVCTIGKKSCKTIIKASANYFHFRTCDNALHIKTMLPGNVKWLAVIIMPHHYEYELMMLQDKTRTIYFMLFTRADGFNKIHTSSEMDWLLTNNRWHQGRTRGSTQGN